jgi:hypothetical protein
MPLPTTEVFAFSAPKSKAGEISIALNVGVGALHVLHASRAVWRGLHEHLAFEFSEPSAAPAFKSGSRRIVRRLYGAQRDAVFTAVLTRVQREEITQIAACRQAGVSWGAFHQWITQRRAAARLAAGPVLKPGGRIL